VQLGQDYFFSFVLASLFLLWATNYRKACLPSQNQEKFVSLSCDKIAVFDEREEL
jgi:hypothetical protein